MNFAKPTIDFLQRMGWSPERKIDATPYLLALSNDGYSLFKEAEVFLSSFGGLKGDMPAFREKGREEEIHFIPELVINKIYRERVQTYEDRIDEQLVVIGEAYNGHLTLLLSSTGMILGAYDEYLCILGKDVVDGISALFERRDAIEVV